MNDEIVPKGGKMNRVVKIIGAVVLVLAVAGGSFYGGMVYGKSQSPATFAGPGGQGGAPFVGTFQEGTGRGSRTAGQGGQGGMLAGEIVSIADGVMTVKDASGAEVQVKVTDTTLIQKQADVTLDALATGDTVFVSGSRAGDGTYTARSVQVSTGGAFGLGGPGGPPGPNTGTAVP